MKKQRFQRSLVIGNRASKRAYGTVHEKYHTDVHESVFIFVVTGIERPGQSKEAHNEKQFLEYGCGNSLQML